MARIVKKCTPKSQAHSKFYLCLATVFFSLHYILLCFTGNTCGLRQQTRYTKGSSLRRTKHIVSKLVTGELASQLAVERPPRSLSASFSRLFCCITFIFGATLKARSHTCNQVRPIKTRPVFKPLTTA